MRLADLPADAQARLFNREAAPRPKRGSKTSEAADLFAFHLRTHRLPGWIREHRFAVETHERAWRFDFALLEHKIAVEIEGLVVRKIGGQMVCMGRHATIEGYREDCVKYNTAAELGWYVLRFEQSMVRSGLAIATVERVLASRGFRREA